MDPHQIWISCQKKEFWQNLCPVNLKGGRKWGDVCSIKIAPTLGDFREICSRLGAGDASNCNLQCIATERRHNIIHHVWTYIWSLCLFFFYTLCALFIEEKMCEADMLAAQLFLEQLKVIGGEPARPGRVQNAWTLHSSLTIHTKQIV